MSRISEARVRLLSAKMALTLVISVIAGAGVAVFEAWYRSANSTQAILIGVTYAIVSCLLLRWASNSTKPIPHIPICLIVMCLMTAAFLAIGVQLESFSKIKSITKTLFVMVMLAVSAFPLYACVYKLFDMGAKRWTEQTSQIATKQSRWVLAVSIIVVAIAWLVWFLVLYPGVYGYDGAFWLLEYDDPGVPVTSQYSIPYTFLYHFLVHFGYSITGDYGQGFALFAIIQLMFCLYCAARVIQCVQARTKTMVPVLLTALFFAVFPWFPILAVSSAQDAVFMGAFALVVVNALDLRDDFEIFFSKPVHIARFCLAVLLMCLVRANGVYSLVIALPFALLIANGFRLRYVTMILVPIFAVIVFQGFTTGFLGVQKSDSLREMSSVPVMQMSRVYYFEGQDLPDEEQIRFARYLQAEAIGIYERRSEISDPFKGSLDTAAIKADPIGFASLYFEWGIRFPKHYVEAYGLLTLGTWYPLKAYPDERMWHPWIESECLDAKVFNPNYIEIASSSFFPEVDSAVAAFAGGGQDTSRRGAEGFSNIPFLSVVLKGGLYTLLVLLAGAYLIDKKRWSDLAIWALFVGVLLTVALAPVSLCRYLAPIMFSAPCLLILAVLPPRHSLQNKSLEAMDASAQIEGA